MGGGGGGGGFRDAPGRAFNIQKGMTELQHSWSSHFSICFSKVQ